MKATGIVRRLDDLGRIVLPKEIRKTYHMKEGDPLEIYTDNDGNLILKKYSPIFDIGAFASQYVRIISEMLHQTALICDTDKVVAVTGPYKHEYTDRTLHPDFRRFIVKRETVLKGQAEIMPVKQDDGLAFCDQIVVPVVWEGDIQGAIIALNYDKTTSFGQGELNICIAAAKFIVSRLE